MPSALGIDFFLAGLRRASASSFCDIAGIVGAAVNVAVVVIASETRCSSLSRC